MPMHVDGHNHCHILPSLVSRVAAVLQREGVRRVRVPADQWLSSGEGLSPGQKSFLLSVVSDAIAARQIFEAFELESTTAFGGLRIMGAEGTFERIREMITSLPEGVTEWMTHPGYAQVEGGDDFSRSEERLMELHTLTDPSLKALLQENDVRLISWEDSFAPLGSLAQRKFQQNSELLSKN